MLNANSARARKPEVTRSRAGCVQCRQKKRKCDQQKPHCRRCIASKSPCQYIAVLGFRDVTAWAAQKVKAAKEASTTATETRASTSGASLPSDPDTTSTQQISPESSSRETITSGTSPEPDLTHHDLDGHPLIPSLITDTDIANSPSFAYDREEGSSHDYLLAMDHIGPLAMEEHAMTDPPQLLYVYEDASHQDIALANCTGISHHSIPAKMIPDTSWFLHSLPVSHDSPERPNDGVVRTGGYPEQGPLLGSLGQDDVYTAEYLTVLPDTTYPSLEANSRHCDVASTQPQCFVQSASWELHGPSLPRPLSSVPEVSTRDRVYLAHFVTRLVHLLPPQVAPLRQLALTSEPIRVALMAHAAANMANLQGTQEPSKPSGSRWIPKLSHKTRATSLATKAVFLSQAKDQLPLATRMGLLLFLSYYFLEAGTFDDFRCTVKRLDALVLGSYNDLSELGLEQGLMQIWSHVRTLSRRSWHLFRPYGIESQKERRLAKLEEQFASPSQLIDIISLDAMRLSYRIFLLKCMRGYDQSPKEALRSISMWWNILQGAKDVAADQFFEGEFDTILDDHWLFTVLQSFGKRLENFLTPAEFPVDFEALLAERENPLPPLSPGTSPDEALVSFSSHENAMECADYAFAHIACDHRLLEATIRPASVDKDADTPQPGNPWLALLLHIASGLDVAECVRRNTYRKGIVMQLICGALLCDEPAALEFVDGFLRRLIALHACYEDIFSPLYLSSLVTSTLLREYKRGRRVYLCGATYNAWTTKEVVFSESQEAYLIVCGRDDNGRFFNDCVPVVEEIGHE